MVRSATSPSSEVRRAVEQQVYPGGEAMYAQINPRSGVNVDLGDRRVLITGAGSGIGRACAIRLSAAGARPILLDRDDTAVRRTAQECGGEPMTVDLSDPDVIDSLGLDADIVVNNAGFQTVAAIEDFPPDRFAAMLRVMLEAPFRIVRAVLPAMYERGYGRIVNISSVHGHRASPYKAAYVAAKHGLEGLSKVIALEGGPRGVTSNTVCPAYVRTPLVEGQIADQARTHGIDAEQVVQNIMLTQPSIKRLIEPEEVAEVVAFLCTEHASFVNGTSIVMDGGWTAR
jgi:3-hydroxybutyrate dehydrogenase